MRDRLVSSAACGQEIPPLSSNFHFFPSFNWIIAVQQKFQKAVVEALWLSETGVSPLLEPVKSHSNATSLLSLQSSSQEQQSTFWPPVSWQDLRGANRISRELQGVWTVHRVFPREFAQKSGSGQFLEWTWGCSEGGLRHKWMWG